MRTTGRILSVITAFLLMLALTGTLLGVEVTRLTGSQSLHESIALSDGNIDAQMDRFLKNSRTLAESYGISADLITSRVDRETIKDLNRQVIAWWTGIATTGTVEDIPLWDSGDLEDTLLADPDLIASVDKVQLKSTARRIVSEVQEGLKKTVFPARDEILTLGMRRIRKMADVRGILTFLRSLPLAAGLVSLILAGIIVLLNASRRGKGIRYIGMASAGTGILLALAVVLLRLMDLGGMTEQSSALLGAQISALVSRLTVEAAAAAAFLIVAAGLMFRAAGGRRAK